MRVIAAFFGLGTPQALPAPVSVCSHDCKRVERLAKHAISAYWEECRPCKPSFSDASWGAFGVALVVTSCQTVQTTRGGVVGVDRPQQMSVFTPSAAEVAATASQQYLQVTQVAAHKGVLNRDPTQAARVQRIAQRLIPHTAVFRDDAVRWQWQVNVLTSTRSMPGACPAARLPCIRACSSSWSSPTTNSRPSWDTKSRMRCANTCAMGRQQATAVGTAVGSAVLEYFTGVNPGQVGHTFTQAMFVLPNSRENEQEADRIGIELAARAGYDPRAAVSLWQKMAAAVGNRRSGSRRIRPTRRASATQAYAQRVLPLYETAEK